MKAFFRKTDLGGCLTMANGLCWLTLVLIHPTTLPSWALIGLSFVLSIPIAFPIAHFEWLRFLGLQPRNEVLAILVLLGMNSFVWGYGLAWIWRRIAR